MREPAMIGTSAVETFGNESRLPERDALIGQSKEEKAITRRDTSVEALDERSRVPKDGNIKEILSLPGRFQQQLGVSQQVGKRPAYDAASWQNVSNIRNGSEQQRDESCTGSL